MATVTAINAESSTAGSPYEWTAIVGTNGNSVLPTTAALYAGTQGYRLSYAGTGVGGFGMKSFTTQTVIHAKFRWRFSTPHLINGNWQAQGYFTLITAQWYEDNPLVALGVGSNGSGGAYRWVWWGSGIGQNQTTTNFALNQWIAMEVFWAYVATGASVWWFSADGTTIAASNTLSPSYTSADRIRTGNWTVWTTYWPATGAFFDVDDIILYNTYTADVVADYYSGRGIGRGLGRGIMRFIDNEEEFHIPALEGYAWN